MATATLRTVGNSVAVVIPKQWLEVLKLQAGSKVSIELSGDCLTLKPARKRYTLSELMEGLEEGDTLPIDHEFDRAAPVGREVL